MSNLIKKSLVLKNLPELAKLRKEAKAKLIQATRLQEEAKKAQLIVDAIEGVQVYNDFPVRLNSLEGGTEVASGCSDTNRSAFVKPAADSAKFVVTTYRGDGTAEGVPIDSTFSRSAAVQVAKEWVSTGKKYKPAVEASKNQEAKTKVGRGRPPKASNSPQA